MSQISVSLFEGVVLLVISGIFVVAWWGVKRLVKINDDEAETLKGIFKNLSVVCGRLEKIEMWMKMHGELDDERHKENKSTLKVLKENIENLSNKLL